MNRADHKILFVDDDPSLLAAFQRNLRKQFNFVTSLSGPEALEILKTQGPFGLLVVDERMPVMDGIEFLEKAREIAPDSVRIMLTGNADQQTAVDAVNRGQIYRFLNKPCPPEVLLPALENGLQQYNLLRTERELLEGTLTGCVKVLSEVLGMVAPDALGRGQKLRQAMRKFAEHIHADPIWELEVAALLSPIGYAALPSHVLHRLATGHELGESENAIVRRTPQVGHALLVDIPRLKNVAGIVLYQGKNYDGSGFPPDERSGEALPLGARMLKILSDRMVLEADGVVKQRAFEVMRTRTGLYDPKLLDECFICFQHFLSSAISAQHPVRSLFIKELVVGQIVVSDIATPEGLVLVSAGSRLSEMVLRRLANYDELGEVKQPLLIQDPDAQAA